MKSHKGIYTALAILLSLGVLLLLTPSDSLQAANVSRRSNIQSHGTFEGNAETGSQDVMLTASDLTYLADECDKLESIIDGLRLTNNPSIKYTYHHHTGSMYSYGGCFTHGYHVHSGSAYSYGGCYTDGYHVHTSACTMIHEHTSECPSSHKHTESCKRYRKQCGDSGGRVGGDPSNPNGIGTCNRCGASQSYGADGFCHQPDKDSGWYYGCGITVTYTCSGTPNTYTCGSPDNRWSLSCGGSPINRWSPSCGWNDGEIVKAEITFSK